MAIGWKAEPPWWSTWTVASEIIRWGAQAMVLNVLPAKEAVAV